MPFDEGSLTGAIGPDTEFPEGDFRNRYFRGDRKQQVDERVQAILDELGIEREQLAEVALRYILSPSGGVVRDPRHALGAQRRAQRRGRGRAGLPEEQVAALKRHRWVRDFYR